ncbi:MAG: efflux RND transporter permease subunit [Phycisphaerae bacterium]
MLNAIVRFSLRFRGIIVALACALIIYGFYAAYQSKYDIFPEFAPPQVTIQTEAAGLSPEQVEALVTTPVENAVAGVSDVDSLRSASIQGLSVLTVTFRGNVDIFRARQAVAERLTTVTGQLPQSVQAPVMNPLTSSTSVVLIVGMTSDARSLMDVTTAANWIVRPRLLAVPGVAKVVVHGGEVKQYQIQVHTDRLVQYHLGIEDVLAAAQRATAIRGAGFIDTGDQRIILQSEGAVSTVSELAKTVVVAGTAGNVTLGDVANVTTAPQPPQGAASVQGSPGVLVIVSSQYGANTLQVNNALNAAISELKPSLAQEGITLSARIFRPARFISSALSDLRSALLLGAGLVIVVLFLFLFEWRTSLISCAAIPLSLLTAVAVLHFLGFGLNTMTLGGLAIAIGEVVDDAVIDVENILRRLRENAHTGFPRKRFRVVLDASIEVRHAVVYATFAVILVFLPILTMSGVAGRLFRPLGVAYILAVLASLLVALTVTPALSLFLLRKHHPQERESLVVTFLKRHYVRLLRQVEGQPWLVAGSVALAAVAGCVAVPFLGGDFLPQLNEGHFILHMNMVPGTSLAESMRVGRQVTEDLLKLPFVTSVAQHAGRTQEGDDVPGPQESEFEIDLKPLSGPEEAAAMAEIRGIAAAYPGVNASVNTFLVERIDETLSGQNAAVVINIVGDHLDVLNQEAAAIAQILSGIKGAVNVQTQTAPEVPQLQIKLREANVERWGFNRATLLDDIQMAFQGIPVGEVNLGREVFQISVILAPKERDSPSKIGDLLVRNTAGSYAPLRQLADINAVPGRYMIQHDGARRIQTVMADVEGRDVASFMKDARSQIAAKIHLPPGTYLEFGGTAAASAHATRELLLYSGFSILGIMLLLSVVMGNWRNLMLVLINLPLALVGGVVAILVTGTGLSLGAVVGFVTLFGITLRNSIMLISHYEHLVRVEGQPWGSETALRGASERLAPILMTALVTGLGLLPLALGSGDPGREIEGPLAIVILGGLATSTALNLLVIPTLSLRFGRFGLPLHDE